MNKTKSLSSDAGLLPDFVRLKPSLSRLLARIVEPQDIDDILQETYIRVCAANEKTEIVNLRSFMLKTAQNLAFNHKSTAYQRHTQLDDFSSFDMEMLSQSQDLESLFESKERFIGFCKAMEVLPPKCCRVFIMSKIYGLSQQEIATCLGISESTVEKHVAKGLLLCREAMLRMGHMDSGIRNSRVNNDK